MDENEHLLCDQLQILVLDEADRMLDLGFSQQVIGSLQLLHQKYEIKQLFWGGGGLP